LTADDQFVFPSTDLPSPDPLPADQSFAFVEPLLLDQPVSLVETPTLDHSIDLSIDLFHL
jgi:hypothetical protein